jgi:hypothetical protein
MMTRSSMFIASSLFVLGASFISPPRKPVRETPKRAPVAPVAASRATLLASFQHPGVQGVQLSATGDRVATWSEDGSVRVWMIQKPTESQGQLPNGFPAWHSMQATGAPDTFMAGDITTAWATEATDKGIEWLELSYDNPIPANLVRIHETYNPGAVVRVELFDENGQQIAQIPVKDTNRNAPAFLNVSFPTTSAAVSTVKVVLDTSLVPGWNEIDAVELCGPSGRSWAASARASSWYGQGYTKE